MSSVPRVFLAILMAVGISVACLLPPGIHFVSGPLGPAIGGYLAGNKMKLRGGEAVLLGVIIGIVVGVSAPLAFVKIGGLDLSSFALIFFGGFAGIYAMFLSGAAAYFGGSSARNEEFFG